LPCAWENVNGTFHPRVGRCRQTGARWRDKIERERPFAVRLSFLEAYNPIAP